MVGCVYSIFIRLAISNYLPVLDNWKCTDYLNVVYLEMNESDAVTFIVCSYINGKTLKPVICLWRSFRLRMNTVI